MSRFLSPLGVLSQSSLLKPLGALDPPHAPHPLQRSLSILPLLIASAFVVGSSQSSIADDGPTASLSELRQQTRTLLKHQATSAAGEAQDDATTALCDLYCVLRGDARYATSQMLRGDAAKIRRRLLSVARSREQQLRRAGVPRSSELAAQVDRAIAAAESDAAEQVDGAPGGGALADNGWQLVELIQRVVAPDFWEPQGGKGVIRYFAMRRVLVVRATSDVHQQVKDLLTALR